MRFPVLASSSKLIFIASLLTACSSDEVVEVIEGVRPVKIYQVHSAEAIMMRKFPAKVHSAERAELAFRVPGELQSLPAKAGTDGKRGTVLATLDPSEYQIQLNDRKARYQLAQS